MEVMGCPPLSVPTLDPRSYHMEPRQGKKRRNQSETVAAARAVGAEVNDAGGSWRPERSSSRSHSLRDFIEFLTLPAYRLLD